MLAVVADVPLEAAKPEEMAVVEQLQNAPVMAVKPTGEVVEIAQVPQTSPEPRTVMAQAIAPTPVEDAQLPATASSFPLIGLCGLLALSGGLALRSMRQHIQ